MSIKDQKIKGVMGDLFKIIDVVKPKEMETGKEYIHKCPICNGELVAIKNSYNGHLHIHCKGCKFVFMQ